MWSYLTSVKSRKNILRILGQKKTFWQAKPPQWQPRNQRAAPATTEFHSSKSRKDFDLAGFTSRDNPNEWFRSNSCSSWIVSRNLRIKNKHKLEAHLRPVRILKSYNRNRKMIGFTEFIQETRKKRQTLIACNQLTRKQQGCC